MKNKNIITYPTTTKIKMLVTKRNKNLIRYENINECSKILEIDEKIENIFKKIRGIKLIEKTKNTNETQIATGTIKKKETLNLTDIIFPKDLKIINKDKKLFRLNSQELELKIFIKIEM